MLPNSKRNYIIFYIFISFILSTAPISASDFETSEHVHISNIHKIDGDLYAWGEKVTIDGEIKGDFIGGGESVSINGIIDNSVNIFSNKFSHSGEIFGTLRLFVNDGIIDGTVERSGLFFCNELKLGKNAEFGDDIHFRGGNITIEGTVHGDATIYSSGTTVFYGSGINVTKQGTYISGTIDGDLTIHGDNIHIVPPALIKGNLKYVSSNQADIDISSGVTILGNTTWDLPENTEEEEGDSILMITIQSGSRLIAAFLFGLILMLIGKKYIRAMVVEVQERFAISAAVGFISLAVLVIFIIIIIFALILLIIGFVLLSKGETVGGAIILALSTIVIPISSVSIATIGTMIYSGKIILALLLGHTVVSKLKSNPAYLSKSQLLLGLCILYVLFAIPYVGTLLFVIISLIGVGAIVLGFKNCQKETDINEIRDQVGI